MNNATRGEIGLKYFSFPPASGENFRLYGMIQPKGSRKRSEFLICVISLLFSLVISEVIFRIGGFLPRPRDSSGTDIIEVDKLLGWDNRPGLHTITAPDSGRIVPVTINKDHSRASCYNDEMCSELESKEEVLIVGCSFAYGYGLGDSEHIGALLQNRLPDYHVKNLAVNGYGTLQSLLKLNKYLKEGEHKVSDIIYVFIAGHEVRNTMNAEWLGIMAQVNNLTGRDLPYAYIDKTTNKLMSSSLRYPYFLFQEYSALIVGVRNVYVQLYNQHSLEEQHSVTLGLIEELNKSADKIRARLSIIQLTDVVGSDDSYNFYAQNIDKMKIPRIGLLFTRATNPELYFHSDPHPNALGVKRVADEFMQGV